MNLHVPMVFRLLLLTVFGFALPFVLPVVPASGGESLVREIMLVFSFLVGFLINRALQRKVELSGSSANELSRLRRIYHISEEAADEVWRKQTFKLIDAYQKMVSKNFVAHGATLNAFEKLTHHIYSFIPADRREELLFTDLLATTRELGLERQKRENAVAGGLSGYSWLVICAYVLLLVIMLLLHRTGSGSSYFAVGATITGIFLILDLLYRLNKLSRLEIVGYEKRYAKNLPHQK